MPTLALAWRISRSSYGNNELDFRCMDLTAWFAAFLTSISFVDTASHSCPWHPELRRCTTINQQASLPFSSFLFNLSHFRIIQCSTNILNNNILERKRKLDIKEKRVNAMQKLQQHFLSEIGFFSGMMHQENRDAFGAEEKTWNTKHSSKSSSAKKTPTSLFIFEIFATRKFVCNFITYYTTKWLATSEISHNQPSTAF